MRRSWGPGWALVGDAGYYKDPITTHGMTDALSDAELLADAIIDQSPAKRLRHKLSPATSRQETDCPAGTSLRLKASPPTTGTRTTLTDSYGA